MTLRGDKNETIPAQSKGLCILDFVLKINKSTVWVIVFLFSKYPLQSPPIVGLHLPPPIMLGLALRLADDMFVDMTLKCAFSVSLWSCALVSCLPHDALSNYCPFSLGPKIKMWSKYKLNPQTLPAELNLTQLNHSWSADLWAWDKRLPF